MGPDAKVERVQHLITGEGLAAGERRCAYRVGKARVGQATEPERKRSRKTRSRL